MDSDGDYEPDQLGDEAYDEYERTPGGKRIKAGGYQLTNVLKLPRATTYSTQALYGPSRPRARHTSVVAHAMYRPGARRGYRPRTRVPTRYVMPPLARAPRHASCALDVVWPESKQIGLIDSIFRNFYVPPVIFGMSGLGRPLLWPDPDSQWLISTRTARNRRRALTGNKG